VIPIACPNCGRRGNVPPDKLNARLHCKKCDAVFHLDTSGHVVLGEPGGPPKKPSGSKAAMPTAAAAEPMELGKNLALAWKGLPKAARVAIVVALVVGGLMVSGVRLPRLSFVAPTELGPRSDFLANAFIDENTSKINRVAAPGTEADAAAWFAKVRPTFKHTGPRQQGNIVQVIRIPISEDAAKKQALFVHNLTSPRREPEKDKTKEEKRLFVPGHRLDGSFDLPTIWKQADDGLWYLDGTATLKAIDDPPSVGERPSGAAGRTTSRRAR
jgi:hypothetical protein